MVLVLLLLLLMLLMLLMLLLCSRRGRVLRTPMVECWHRIDRRGHGRVEQRSC